jgi:hypothetical protein
VSTTVDEIWFTDPDTGPVSRGEPVGVPNLKDLYGEDYQIRVDEGCEHRDDPAMWEIPARYGRFYAYGEGLIAVEIDYHNKVAGAVGRLEGTTLVQDGDEEKTYTFPPELFPQVAELVHPYRRVRSNKTPEQLAALVEAGSSHRFKKHGAHPGLPGAPGQGPGGEGSQTPPEAV